MGVEPRGLIQGKGFEGKYLFRSDRALNSWGDWSVVL
jgi:hypothetical protein